MKRVISRSFFSKVLIKNIPNIYKKMDRQYVGIVDVCVYGMCYFISKGLKILQRTVPTATDVFVSAEFDLSRLFKHIV
jgi:hypothetical protein